MEERTVGRSGLRVSALGLGTLTWGRDTDEHEAADLLQRFVGAGGTLVDTAPSYGDGAAEEMVGALLGPVVHRDDVVICTKAGLHRSGRGRRVDTGRRALMRALDGSLTRLGTDHVDLWLVHTWSDEAPLEETLATLDWAVTSGRARYTGVSNHAGWQLARAATLAGDGPGRLVAVQAEYSLVQRGVERELLPAAQALEVGLMASSPLGRGVLTGKYRNGTPGDSRAASKTMSAYVGQYLDARSRGVVDALCIAAQGLGCTPGQVALSWLLGRPGVACAVTGPRLAGQLKQSLDGLDVDLPHEILAVLDEVCAPVLGYPEIC